MDSGDSGPQTDKHLPHNPFYESYLSSVYTVAVIAHRILRYTKFRTSRKVQTMHINLESFFLCTFCQYAGRLKN
jgi:hypothetical protein